MNASTNNELSTNDQKVTGHGARIEGVVGFTDSACKVSGSIDLLHGTAPAPALDHQQKWSNGSNAVRTQQVKFMNTLTEAEVEQSAASAVSGHAEGSGIGSIEVVNATTASANPAKDKTKPVRRVLNDTDILSLPVVESTAERINGIHTAKIVQVVNAESKIKTRTVNRLYFEIELETKRDDGKPYTAEYNCHLAWKPGSQYVGLIETVLGRSLSHEEMKTGIQPATLKNRPFSVFVTEHLVKGGESRLKIRELKPLESKQVAKAA
jgi:hypothetical protein